MQVRLTRGRKICLGSFITLILVFTSGLCLFGQAASGSNTKSAGDLAALRKMLKAKKPIIWVLTGDSITEGAKWTRDARSYPEIFSERIRWEMGRSRDLVINTAISGNKTDDLLNDFDWRVAHLRPNVVTLMFGMNDAVNGAAGEGKFEANLRHLVHRVRSMGAIPILQTTNWTLDDARRRDLPVYNAIIRQVAEADRVILVDNLAYWQQHRSLENLNEWLANPIHPNGQGHAVIAHAMFLSLGLEDPDSPMFELGNP